MSVTSSIPSTLLDAARSSDWRAMPAAIAAYRDKGGDIGGTAFWEAAALACGCPAHALRQKCAAYGVVSRNIRELGKAGVRTAFSRQYTQLELIARIEKSDHQVALELLRNPHVDNSVSKLRARLVEVRGASGMSSGLALGHKALSDARDLVAHHLEAHRSEAFGPRFIYWKGGNRFVSPTAVTARKTEEIVATEALLVTAKTDDVWISKSIAKAAFESSFFDQYWLGVPSALDGALIADNLGRLGLSNVGLVTFDTERKQVRTLVPAGTASPVLDRRGLLDLPPYYFS